MKLVWLFIRLPPPFAGAYSRWFIAKPKLRALSVIVMPEGETKEGTT